jgi:putative methyltransferase (TIGR04325 family)
MSLAKTLAKDWLPPAVLRALVSRPGIRFTGDFSSWPEAAACATGYDSELILERVLAATLKVKNGDAAYERDSVLFERTEYVWPVTTALMWAAARNHGELHVLDFGGSLGSSYFQNRALLAPLHAVSWGIIEQPAFVRAGRKHVEDDRLRFWESIDDCLAQRKPNVILLSSVLQYLENAYETLRQLAAARASVIVLDRTPFADDGVERIAIQEVPPSIYPASYPMRVLSTAAVLDALGPAYRSVATFTSPEGSVRTSALQFSFMGMILELTGDERH